MGGCQSPFCSGCYVGGIEELSVVALGSVGVGCSISCRDSQLDLRCFRGHYLGYRNWSPVSHAGGMVGDEASGSACIRKVWQSS